MKKTILGIAISSAIFGSLSFALRIPSVEKLDFYGSENSYSLDSVVQDAIHKKKTPVILVHAKWCGSCKSFLQAVNTQPITSALSKSKMILIDIDKDTLGIASDYNVRFIPNFIKVDSNLNRISQITSDKWQEATPKNMGLVMDSLVNLGSYD